MAKKRAWSAFRKQVWKEGTKVRRCITTGVVEKTMKGHPSPYYAYGKIVDGKFASYEDLIRRNKWTKRSMRGRKKNVIRAANLKTATYGTGTSVQIGATASSNVQIAKPLPDRRDIDVAVDTIRAVIRREVASDVLKYVRSRFENVLAKKVLDAMEHVIQNSASGATV